MNPIQIKISGSVQKSSEEICSVFLDIRQWSKFTGYSFLPGVKNANFELKTPSVVGSRIKVLNTDGSSHVEEIIEWDVKRRVALRFQEFDSPLKFLATHFIEAWKFSETDNGTEIIRTMTMYPKGVIGWLMLLPISRLMKKAFEKNVTQMNAQ